MKPVLLIAAFVAGACIASSSSANSRFTVDNQVDESVKVRIFNGGDGSCDIKLKSKTVGAGKSESFGCDGNGKQRCKIQVLISGSQECSGKQDTCDKDAIIIKNGQTVSVYKTGNFLNPYNCQLQ